MERSTSKIYDDYEDYKSLCDKLNVHESRRKAVHGVDSFWDHAGQLIKFNKKLRKEIGEYLYNKFA